MSKGDKLNFISQFNSQIIHIQSSILKIDIDKLCPSLAAGFLPRNDVGMVFHDRNQDLVSLSQDFLSITRHPVQTGCRSSGKENFLCRACIDKLTNGFTSCLIRSCRPFCQGMNTTMNIGIVLLIVAVNRFQNC